MRDRAENSRTALLFAGGEETGHPPLPDGDHWVVCADSGYRLCRRMGLRPDLVIGDMDSLAKFELEEIGQQGIHVESYPAEKDESDLELALQWVHSRGVREVWLFGLLGGRLDHCLFNLVAILSQAGELGMRARACSTAGEFWVVDGSSEILGRRGWICSLLPLQPTVERVTLAGFQYSLQGESLHQTKTRSLSNRIVEDRAQIEVGGGRLLVMLIPQEAYA